MEDSNLRYTFKSEIGKGGMGTIQEVEDKILKRNLAMKILDFQSNSDPVKMQRFLDEAMITAQLEHPNIIPVYDIGIISENKEQSETSYYTMKLLKGESLELILDRIKAGDSHYKNLYPLLSRINIFRKICDAIAYAHSHGVIHRDIKPDNIMIGEFGEVVLIDWGLATYDTGSRPSNSQTKSNLKENNQTSKIIGSPWYFAPEQATGQNERIDRQTDVFLLGSTLFHILTLEAPYTGENYKDCILKAMHCKFPHPHSLENGKNIPNALVEVLLKAMSFDKLKRFSSVEEFSQAIDNYLTNQTSPKRIVLKKGDKIDLDNKTYFLISGCLEGQSHTNHTKILKTGDLLGRKGTLSEETKVLALEKSELLLIDNESLEEELKRYSPWIGNLMKSLLSIRE